MAEAPGNETANLNVASDATTIYEGGRLIPVNTADLINNEIALRQLVNTLNLSNRDIDHLKGELEQLRLERAAHMAQPALAVFLSIVNVCGAVLLALGVNFVTSTPPVRGGTPIAAVGAILTLTTAIAPVVLPAVIDFFRRRNDAL